MDIFALSLDVRGKTWFLVILINVGDNNKIQIYTTVPEGEVSQKGEINACHIAAFWLKRLLYARSTSKEMQNIAFNWHCRAILILIWWHESAYRIIWWSPLHLEEKIKKKRWKRTHERKRKTSWCPYVQISPTKKTTVFIFCDVCDCFSRFSARQRKGVLKLPHELHSRTYCTWSVTSPNGLVRYYQYFHTFWVSKKYLQKLILLRNHGVGESCLQCLGFTIPWIL